MTRRDLRKARRLVVKIGTSLLVTPEGRPHTRRFASLARDVAELREDGREVVLVSSGAVGLGLQRLGRADRPSSLPELQAAAAIGQIDLCRRLERAFDRHGLLVGQILLTHVGLSDRERFLNARHTLNALLASGAVPIINENDSVATEELRFGDNDELAALVVNTCNADLLLLLTDIDGLHDRHPAEPDARRIADIPEVTHRVLELAAPPTSRVGTGGMPSKLEAARTAARSGAATVLCHGRGRDILARVTAGEKVGTLFLPGERLTSRKHWLAFTAQTRGELVIDEGAEHALLRRGRSLLPVGVVEVRGHFRIGDSVACLNERGQELARGLAAYPSEDVARIRGLATREIPLVLGYSNGEEVIHRDDLVLLENESKR